MNYDLLFGGAGGGGSGRLGSREAKGWGDGMN